MPKVHHHPITLAILTQGTPGLSFGHQSDEEHLNEAGGGLNVEKRRLRGDNLTLYNSLTGWCSQVSISLFSQITGSNVTGQEKIRLKLHQGKFRLDIGKILD